MSEVTVENLRETLEAKREKLQRQLDEVEQALRGLSLAVKHHGKSAGRTGRRSGKLVRAVQSAVDEREGPFTSNDILEALRRGGEIEEPKPASVSSVLRRLADKQVVTILEQGAGKKPTTFLKYRYYRENHIPPPPSTA